MRSAFEPPANLALFDRLIRAHVLVGHHPIPAFDATTQVPTVNGVLYPVLQAAMSPP